MAIQPIDLQALFSQLDKVGKTQAVIREGQQLQDALQQNQIQRRLEENVRSVNEAQDMGDETIKVKEEKGSGAQGKGRGRQEEADESPALDGEEEQDFIRDPALGRNIDITG